MLQAQSQGKFSQAFVFNASKAPAVVGYPGATQRHAGMNSAQPRGRFAPPSMNANSSRQGAVAATSKGQGHLPPAMSSLSKQAAGSNAFFSGPQRMPALNAARFGGAQMSLSSNDYSTFTQASTQSNFGAQIGVQSQSALTSQPAGGYMSNFANKMGFFRARGFKTRCEPPKAKASDDDEAIMQDYTITGANPSSFVNEEPPELLLSDPSPQEIDQFVKDTNHWLLQRPEMKFMKTTVRDYFEDTYKFEQTVKITSILGQNKSIIVTDKTIFHPQGGGQPKDRGFFQSEDGNVKFIVEEISPKDDAILHIGRYVTDNKFELDQDVVQKIDGEFRMTNARNHSAGHLLDVAMQRAGRSDLTPDKGYHYQEGPYVQYKGAVPEEERQELIKTLNKHCKDLIQEAQDSNLQVFRKMCSFDEANEQLQKSSFDFNFKEGADVRVLKMTAQDSGCPCGGTHVHSLGEIGTVEVTKIKKKKKNVQLSYRVIPPQ